MNSSESKSSETRNILILRTLIAVLMILLAAALRILPHPWNLTPVGAMAIFSGSVFRNRWAAFLLPLAALFAGDLFVALYKLMFIVYISFALSVLIGRKLAPWHSTGAGEPSPQPSFPRIGGAVLLGAMQFFLVTNFGIWALGGFYARTAAGLAACYTAGIPYFWNTLAGDVIYASLLFGGYALAEKLLSSTATLGCATRDPE